MNTTNKLGQFIGVAGNISQLIIASSIVFDLYLRFRNKTAVPVNTPDDNGDNSPSPEIPLTNAA